MDDETKRSQLIVKILVSFSFSMAVIIAGCFYYYKNIADKRYAGMAKVIMDASLDKINHGYACPSVPTLYSMGDQNPALREAVFSKKAAISVNCGKKTVVFLYTKPPKTFTCLTDTCKPGQ